jgi:enterochelin esterase family protein
MKPRAPAGGAARRAVLGRKHARLARAGALTREGKLPPAVYVLIDAIDTAHRSRELPCNPDFWLAVQEELLPLVKRIAPFSDRADRTVVAGRALAALFLYAGLNWPQRFGCVLSQSGSYWWPHRGAQQEGLLIEQLKAGEKTARGLRIVLEAGRNEPLIFRANQAIYAELHAQQVTGVRLTADTMRFAGAVG